MSDRNGRFAVFAVMALLLLTVFTFRQATSKDDNSTGFVTPVKPPADSDSIGAEAANTFMSLNGPGSSTNRGQPDPSNSFGANTPVVWETFKNSSELFRPQGATPPEWNTNCELPGDFPNVTTSQLQQQFGNTNSSWVHYLSESRMIDGQQIVDANGAVIRYDVRCNQTHFNYVASNPSGYQLFNVEGQQQALTDSKFTFSFPAESIEVKASWRVLNTTDDDSRYWTAYGAFYDDNGNPTYAKIGLTAFHFNVRNSSQWVFFTYEQVDNPTATFKYFLQEKGKALGTNDTINPKATKFNSKLQQQTRGTKWQYYQIIGWQDSETDSKNGMPVLLANSNIESYFPQTSSCMSCHAMANVGPADSQRLSFWHTSRKGIKGRIGEIDFDAIAKKLDPDRTYKQMDYVWSLRQAQSTKAPTEKATTTPASNK